MFAPVVAGNADCLQLSLDSLPESRRNISLRIGICLGRKQIGTILGWSTFLSAVGNSVGPVFGGLVKDISGSYEGAFFTVATISVIGALFFIFATKPTLPEQTQAVSESQPST